MLRRQQQEQQWAERQSLWGQSTRWGNGPDDGTGKEAEGFLRSQGRDFTPERRSAHVVGFRPPCDKPGHEKDWGDVALDHGLKG